MPFHLPCFRLQTLVSSLSIVPRSVILAADLDPAMGCYSLTYSLRGRVTTLCAAFPSQVASGQSTEACQSSDASAQISLP